MFGFFFHHFVKVLSSFNHHEHQKGYSCQYPTSTSGDEEVEVDPRVLNNLSQEVRDLKIQMASIQANLQLIANQLTRPNHNNRASPRPSRAPSRHEYVFEEEEDECIH